MKMRHTIVGGAGIARRDFLRAAGVAAAATALPACVTNPVTQRRQLMLLSEADEIGIDRTNAPHAFAEDFGTLPMPAVNAYLERVGQDLAGRSHRPGMPYSFRAVNASHVNAYAFPGGSIATTRGILLNLDNEAELAALLGHEIGHVNARHTAARMSQGILLQLAVAGTSLALSRKDEDYGEIAAIAGGLGASLLLAHYSREDERQADALGMEYLARTGYSPRGMVGLMGLLQRMSEREPNALELMFATHPMSRERYDTAVRDAAGRYAANANFPLNRERFMDETAPLRPYAETVTAIRRGDKNIAGRRPGDAESCYRDALARTPDDYEGMVKLSRCLIALGRVKEAELLAQRAQQVLPKEAMAYRTAGLAALEVKRFKQAHQYFGQYEKVLPGNPETYFYDALALDGLGLRGEAAKSYGAYLQRVQDGAAAQHATRRLSEWNYLKP